MAINFDYNIDKITLNGIDATGTVEAATLVKTGGTSSQFLKADGTVDSNTYLTSEVNDLTINVTWDIVPDAYISQSSVTQHESALTITQSQISDLNVLELDALSVVTNSPSGIGSLAYSNITGTFTYTPPFPTLDSVTTNGNSTTNTVLVGSLGVGNGITTPAESIEVAGNVEAVEFIGQLRGPVLFKAQAGEALVKGDVVYISGISGQTTLVSKADADDASKMPAFGLVSSDSNINTACEVITFGTLSGISTNTYTEGDELYVSTTPGVLQNTAPTGESSLIQKIAKVTRSAQASGSLKVMGAGRTNAVPNLNDGNIFIGNNLNQPVTITLDTSIVPENNSLYFTTARVDAHLNTSTATANDYLKWNGTDYEWDTVPPGYTDSDVDAHLNQNTATANTILQWNGNDYSWGAITESQISDLQTYYLASNPNNYISTYTVTQSDVTQHQAALSITESQISDLQTYYLASNPNNYISTYTVTQSDVTQHQAALSITESQISDFQSYQLLSQKGSANGYASLDTGGKVPTTQLPALALTEVSVVANQAARLALTAQEGDVAIQTDISTTFIHNGGTAGTTADWEIIEAPVTETDPVFTASTAFNISDGTGFLKNNGSGVWSYDSNTYLTSFTETDPVFSAATVSNITDGTGRLQNDGLGNWSYDNATYLTSFTETDPVFSAATVSNISDGTGFLKNNGSGVWSYDNNTYLTSFTETDPVFSAATVSNISDGTGFLKNNGSGVWSYDNNTYLTAESDTLATVTARGATTSDVITVSTGTVVLGGSGTIAATTCANGAFHLGSATSGWAMDANEFYNSGAAIIGTLDSSLTLNPATSTTTSRPFISTNDIEATSFTVTSGTSSQFLKADGSVDSSTYLTGNQTITLSGDVTGSGTTAITCTVVNDSHTHDTRYYTETEIDTFIDHSYTTSQSATNLPIGWYTIATVSSGRAIGRFAIWDINSSDHQACIFYAAHHFGTDASNTLTCLMNSYFSGNPFRYIRIKDLGTYDGAAVQIYIDDASNQVRAAIVGDNVQDPSWVLKDWVADATDPGDVSTASNSTNGTTSAWASFVESSRLDLNQIAQGGISTTGPIYADGDTVQFRHIHGGNNNESPTLSGDNTLTFGPNTGNSAYLRLGGSNPGPTADTASIATSNGNLHMDAAESTNGIYLNWYSNGTLGTYFGDGASGQVGRIDASGNLTLSGTASATTGTFSGTGNANRLTLETDTALASGGASSIYFTNSGTLMAYLFAGGTNEDVVLSNFSGTGDTVLEAGGFLPVVATGTGQMGAFGSASAAAPSLVFRFNELDTGFYRSGADTISISHQGTQKIIFGTSFLSILHSTASTSTTSGALVVSGGAGIQGNLSGTTASFSGTVSISGSSNLDMLGAAPATDARYLYLPRGGGITLYGNTTINHGIFSRDLVGTVSDDVRINSYGGVSIILDTNNNNSSGADFHIGRHSTGTADLGFVVSGETYDVTTEGNLTAYGTVSDIRYKEDIEKIDSPVERLQKINGVTFKYKEKEDRLMGVIAQELLEDEILKLAVYENETIQTKEKRYAVRYEHLTAMLIEAIKEQQAQIDELKEMINGSSN